MLGEGIGRGAMWIINAMVRGLASLGVPPNILTTIGVSINVFCGILFGMGEFFYAGVVLIIANIFDMLDGNVARLTGNVTKFGGFLDSSLDRLSDMVAFLGIMVFYASNTPQHSLLNVILGGVAMIGSVMVSYTTARSESLGVKANVGFLQRPERIVLLIIGALSTWDWNSEVYWFNRMPQVLWVLAVGSIWTLVHRMYFIWTEFRRLETEGELR
ncbi:MAG: CDP-alcohol phosphatidyltransferase family protein [Blastocatellia bacterium]|nr:CDP-alcohol phosphatidyltransferase family protein [Chloracidobacterium sp.]MBL8183819.1 CDP-alcohol phosphatidyltransferase family protein [Blastocatellia bacterium]HBE82676.1 CDP-alcohol phosphatidyltransferase family protein [Blastocatellia bacterium]HRK51496.1 CDP-alcohol phosphatidyltransferase family protein [Pyrinomonadaceae bacterium]